jgi:predicted Zn-dependent peptidase
VAAYQDCFSVPKEFSFVITGVHDLEKTIALLARYLGNLPMPMVKSSGMHTLLFKDLHRVIDRTVIDKYKREHAADYLLFVGRYASEREKIKIQLLCSILQSAYRQRLREVEGGTYVAYSSIRTWKESPAAKGGVYELRANFECSPEFSRKLLNAALDENELLKKNGPDPVEFDIAVRELKKGGILSGNVTDRSWAALLCEQCMNDGELSLAGIFGTEALLNSITMKDIQHAARDYLPKNAYVSYIETSEN